MADALHRGHSEAASGLLRLRDFLHECVGSAPAEEADRVREALLLLPRPAGAARPSDAGVEAMLDSGATLCAVLALIGNRTPFLLSRGQGQTHLATVLGHDGQEEMVSEGPTLALALLTAHVSACLMGLERTSGLAEMPTLPLSARLH